MTLATGIFPKMGTFQIRLWIRGGRKLKEVFIFLSRGWTGEMEPLKPDSALGKSVRQPQSEVSTNHYLVTTTNYVIAHTHVIRFDVNFVIACHKIISAFVVPVC
jgi:hypothetical protein